MEDFKKWQQDEVHRHMFLRGAQALFVLFLLFLLFLLWVVTTGGGVE